MQYVIICCCRIDCRLSPVVFPYPAAGVVLYAEHVMCHVSTAGDVGGHDRCIVFI